MVVLLAGVVCCTVAFAANSVGVRTPWAIGLGLVHAAITVAILSYLGFPLITVGV